MAASLDDDAWEDRVVDDAVGSVPNKSDRGIDSNWMIYMRLHHQS